ncbi:methionine permease [Blastocladiella emersonii ATCC 22665]|nr:methionine permease [Blastocladiella emersonii ATCC 22665]KAI9179868.1 methionine permease [Blastocladiella emersonii ATCC 22665]
MSPRTPQPTASSSDKKVTESVLEQCSLGKSLGAVQGAALIAGGMIGSGIFTNPGKVVGIIGSVGPSLILWVFGAFVAFTGALNYAELGSRITVSGGDAPFLDAAYRRPRRFVAIMYSWTRVVLINPGYNASLAVMAGTYLASAFPATFPEDPNVAGGEYYAKMIGAILLVIQTLACVPSNNLAGNFITFVTAIAVLCLLAFSTTGMFVLFGVAPSVRQLDNFSAAHLFAGTTTNPGDWASALFKVLWSLDGFSCLASSLSELKDPERNVRRSTVMGISTVCILYILANISYLVVLNFADMSTLGSGIASQWATNMFGPTGQVVVMLLIFLCVSSCCFVSLFVASRVGHATGESGLMYPSRFFSNVNARFGTPVNALFFNFVMSMLLLLIPQGDTFWFIIDLVSYPVWAFYGITALGLLVLKYRATGNVFKRDPNFSGFQVSAFSPILMALVSTFLVVFPFFQEAMVLSSSLALACIALGVIPYFLLSRAESLAAASSTTL